MINKDFACNEGTARNIASALYCMTAHHKVTAFELRIHNGNIVVSGTVGGLIGQTTLNALIEALPEFGFTSRVVGDALVVRDTP